MHRRNRVALLAALALVLAATGTVLGTRAPDTTGEPVERASSHAPEPQTDEVDVPPTAEELAHAAMRLQVAGIDPTELEELAAVYGLGGAVRLLAWADETGTDLATLRAMRDGDAAEGSGLGWGQMAKELGVHPGIGSIMGSGGGHGRDDAPGQQGSAEEGGPADD